METLLQYLIMLLCFGFVNSVERGFVYCPAYPCACESEDGGLIINCRNLYLSSLPKFLSFEGRIKELSLRHNSIKSLPARGFLSLHVDKLDLLENAVSSIHKDAFSGLEDSLRWLSIQLYAVDGFPTVALSRLYRLRHLMIVGCKQQELAASLFMSLTKLEELHLIGCRITNILPGTFNPLSHLNTLVLAQNALHFHNIPEINLLEKLVYLDLSFNDIQFLENMAFSWLSKLRTLKLGANKLRHIASQAFYNLDFCLEDLDLSENSLTQQDLGSLANLKKVRSLDLSSNNIFNLSGEYFASMRYLTHLNIARNNLEIVNRRSFQGLVSVTKLVMSNNPLRVLENGTFLELNELEILSINNTVLGGTFRLQTLAGLSTSLMHLNVGNSSIISRDLQAFSHLTNLTSLDLSRNYITDLDLNVIRKVGKLQFLNLSYNNISMFVDARIRSFDSSLKVLDLSWNKIQTIKNCSFFAFKELIDIRLDGNPLFCNCSLSWLFRWIQMSKSNQNQDNNEWKCSSPGSLMGAFLFELEFSDFKCSNSSFFGDVCLTSETLLWIPVTLPSIPVTTTETTISQLSVTTSECDTICLNITRPDIDSVYVEWLAEDIEHIFGFNLIVIRQNDSFELQSAAVSANTTNYTLQLGNATKQEVCVVAMKKDLQPLAKKCDGVPTFVTKREEGTRKEQLNLIHNSFIPLLFVYISGSFSFAFILACLIVYARRKRKRPKRVKPMCVAYPAWLDHRTSAASTSLTHEPHFLNTLFVDNNRIPDSRTVSNYGTISDSRLGANLPLDSPISLSSRRASGIDNAGISCALSGPTEVGDDFFFHF